MGIDYRTILITNHVCLASVIVRQKCVDNNVGVWFSYLVIPERGRDNFLSSNVEVGLPFPF